MNEGKNGRAKDPAREAIGTKGIRRIRGMAANGILLACQLAAQNLNSVKNFLLHARQDSTGKLRRTYTNRGTPGPAPPPRDPPPAPGPARRQQQQQRQYPRSNPAPTISPQPGLNCTPRIH